MIRCCSLLLPLALFATSTLAPEDIDQKKMQGVWLPATAELGGQPFPDELRKTIKLELKDDKYTVTAGVSVDKGTIKLKCFAKPKPNQMEIVGVEGPSKGLTIPAIYEFDGEKLRVCYDLSATGYPAEFKTKEKTLLYLVTYEREKK